MTTQAIQQREPQTLRGLLESPAYLKRFEEILGKRTPQFVSSVLSVGTSLGTCEPKSIITAAMTAATLDLPVDKNLGFAWIVPYKGKAQFQMGYKGYVQLGLRTGQYERMNARVINAEAFQGWDEVGEPVIDWTQIDEAKPSVGYVFAFKLVNGFTKIAYWPRERVEAHAQRFSQSYGGKYDSPWKSNFDAMALKTVIKNELSRWGILSIEMQQAIKLDQAIQEDLGAEPSYLDGTDNDHPQVDQISEEQRTALVDLAKEVGVVEQLGQIVNEAGFEMLAHITVDRFGDVQKAIYEAAIPDADEVSSESESNADKTPAPKMSKAESQKADHIAAIQEIEQEDPERVAIALEGRDLEQMTPGQVKDLYLALTAG